MPDHPRAALILLSAEWFNSVVALPALVEALKQDRQAILDALSRELDLSPVHLVESTGSLQAACRDLKAAEVDLVILAFQAWAEDFYLIPLLEAVGHTPLSVWCYQPWLRPPRPAAFVDLLRGSGMVGTFEGLGTIRNIGRPFLFTYGAPAEPRVVQELATAARAARVVRALKSARFGLLPARNEQMQSTFVDEFRLRADLGPALDYLSAGMIRRAGEALTEQEVDAFLADVQARFPVRGVAPATLRHAARMSLGMARLAAERSLDVLVMNDISAELHAELGLRPCLYPDVYERSGIVVGLEGDVGAGTALFILDRLTGAPLLFTEFWFWDEPDNVIVGGHAGLQNPAVAEPGQAWITHDYEYAQTDPTEGAHLQFVARPGRVTLLQLRGTPGGWQAMAATGEAIATPPMVEGYPHAVVRLDAGVRDFITTAAKVGSTQHWAMAHGDARAELRIVCELLGVPLAVIG